MKTENKKKIVKLHEILWTDERGRAYVNPPGDIERIISAINDKTNEIIDYINETHK